MKELLIVLECLNLICKSEHNFALLRRKKNIQNSFIDFSLWRKVCIGQITFKKLKSAVLQN